MSGGEWTYDRHECDYSQVDETDEVYDGDTEPMVNDLFRWDI